MSIFVEHLANGLLVRYATSWNIENPSEGADERAIRINTPNGTTDLVKQICVALSIDFERFVAAFPTGLVVYWNAGEVFCRIAGIRTKLIIWPAFRCSTFAATRFGSRKAQPDFEALKRIQYTAIRAPFDIDSNDNSTSNSSSTTNCSCNDAGHATVSQQPSWLIHCVISVLIDEFGKSKGFG
ncbi:unnamed protein product [Anisakis simplex]|uniref:Anti_prolifrtn domain-containing protein n=1 Tax=Anisakis simplex TaxID=6269 RepID=A0A0M3JX92_ANISI|nr:unnamed protein product [Anisakis simplex]